MRRKKKNKKFKELIIIALIIILILLGYEYFRSKNQKDNTQQAEQNVSQIQNEENKIEEKVKEEPKEDSKMKMTVIGDIMCHNTQYNDAYVGSSGTYDFSYVFKDIKEYISSADLAIGNLETTFAGKERGYSSYPTFNTPEELAENLKNMGIDVVSTANNHCIDKGYKGIVSTLDYLDSAGIAHTGTSRSIQEQETVLVKDVNGIKMAFLSFTYGTNGIPIPSGKEYSVNLIDDDFIVNQINLAKKENPDIICVSMHWGVEYQTKQNKEQERLAELLFKNGVDIILGSHPHVLQPMEKKTITLDDGTTKDGFVIYSLGNFMSGQVKENTRNSVILNLQITKNGETGKISIDNINYIPIYMYKAATGSVQRYRILDIEKSIENYETGKNTSIGQIAYNTIKKELVKIKQIMD